MTTMNTASAIRSAIERIDQESHLNTCLQHGTVEEDPD